MRGLSFSQLSAGLHAFDTGKGSDSAISSYAFDTDKGSDSCSVAVREVKILAWAPCASALRRGSVA